MRRLPTVSGHPDNLQSKLPSGVPSPEIEEDAHPNHDLSLSENRAVGARGRHDLMKGASVAGQSRRNSELAHARYWEPFLSFPMIPLCDVRISRQEDFDRAGKPLILSKGVGSSYATWLSST